MNKRSDFSLFLQNLGQIRPLFIPFCYNEMPFVLYSIAQTG
ncbi:hypothetical protein HMPREF0027_2091 [Actinobacillus ureae ATCC 25976]|uniref:Uncharacterized protein n=1 Tax=Actinobacillus ureae ATCC 25976 TaxID=887324 RepID=E8KJS4_9PAST|nr:hypothetical protein HMPREF0027_2091 [Actinobacillus ureae ATCC 25976]